MNVIIHCDTSFKQGVSCTGYIIDVNGVVYKGSSEPFLSNNNNEAEITGIIISCQIALLKIGVGIHVFDVFNDNIVAVTVTNHNYVPSNKAKKRFAIGNIAQEWCAKNNVKLRSHRKKRSNPLIKECDKLSKAFRKTRSYYDFTNNAK